MSAPRASSTPATGGEVFALIRDGEATTRSEVGRVTGLSRTAVSARISALQAYGLVVEAEEGLSTGGRPPSKLTFNAQAGIVLAAAIGRSRTQLAVCDLAGDLLTMEDVDQEIGVGPQELMPQIAERLQAMIDQVGNSNRDVMGVGLSIPGTVDTTRGCSLDSAMMSGWDEVVLAPYLAQLSSAPVFVDNDANVMVLAERRGHRDSGRRESGHREGGRRESGHRENLEQESFDNVLLIKASTGLGAGIVAGGVLQRGAQGAAGEIGHTKTAAAHGLVCRCGDTGCIEAVAGGWALVRTLQDQGREIEHIRDVVDLALSGDATARRLIRESGRQIGEVLAGAINLLNPDVLVVGGDMAKAYDTFVAGLRETVYGNATALATRELRIMPATHGDRSGVVGSAAMVLEHVLSVRAVDRALGGHALQVGVAAELF